MIEDTPVLLITYRRSSHLNELLNKLINFGFKYIYIYSNSWKNESKEENEVKICRELIIDIEKNFEMEFFLNFSKEHLSVDKSITKAINWFFKNVEQGIILEDDINISLESMQFISNGLNFYRTFNDIASITSFTEYPFDKNTKTIRPRCSYMFHSWGWGTWKKIWKRFDHLDIRNYSIKNDHKLFKNNSALARSFQEILNKCKKRDIVTWDYQFQNFCLINEYKNLMPNLPLVENLGLGDSYAENCLYNSLEFNKIEFEEIKLKKLDIKNLITLNIEDEKNLFKNKYPSIKKKIFRKLVRIFRN